MEPTTMPRRQWQYNPEYLKRLRKMIFIIKRSSNFGSKTMSEKGDDPNSNSQKTGNKKGEKQERVSVIVRCRPMSRKEVGAGYRPVVQVSCTNNTVLIYNPKEKDNVGKQFTFDAVYDENSSQEELYEQSIKPIVSSVLNGYNGTVFAYGQTGTGKTYTMEGSENSKGIIPRAFEQIFHLIDSSTSSHKYLVRAQYLEIYNEEIRDLLTKNNEKKLELRQNEAGVYIKNLVSHLCEGVEDIQKVMKSGNANRTVGATNMNERSSRSHAIFIITVEVNVEGVKSPLRSGKLNLVDLAGSERQAKSGADLDRLKEASKINLSLSALANVISALESSTTTHIPYRDSKLTRLLCDSLGGNSKTIMIANIGPASYNYEESLTTLRYATRAKNIKNKPLCNEDPKDALLISYQEEIKRLKAMLAEQAKSSDILRKKRKRKSEDLMNDTDSEQDNNKTRDEIYQEEEESINKAIEKISSETMMSDADRMKKMKEIEERKAKLDSEKAYVEEIKSLIFRMESKLLSGGKSIIDRTNEQQKLLEQTEAEIREKKLTEMEIRHQIERTEETAEEMRETFQTKQSEVESLRRKVKKWSQKVQAVKKEMVDQLDAYNKDRRELETIQNELLKVVKLNQTIIENFITKEDRKKGVSRLYYDEEEDIWRAMPDSEPAEQLGRLVADPTQRRPTTSYAKAVARIGLSTRYRCENILDLELEHLGRTTRDYEGPAVSPSIKSVMEAALQVEEDIDVDAGPSSRRQSGRQRITPFLRNPCSRQQKPVYPKTRGLVPK